jgi:PadR family transcriptional regulator PadR
VSRHVNVWRTELRRGLVELCVLSVLREKEAYGYQIVEQLRNQAELEFTESTVYPILARLHSEKLLAQRQVRSPAGPPRRYFRLTALGLSHFQEMILQWRTISQRVNQLIEEKSTDVDAH